MRKNSHDKILERELKKQHLSTVLKSYSYLNYIYIYVRIIIFILMYIF